MLKRKLVKYCIKQQCIYINHTSLAHVKENASIYCISKIYQQHYMVFIPFNKWWKVQKLSTTYTNTHLYIDTPTPQAMYIPCSLLTSENRVTHVTHYFAPLFLPRLVPTNPVAILHHLAIRDLSKNSEEPPKNMSFHHQFIYKWLFCLSWFRVKINCHFENTWKISLLTQLGRKGATSD